MGSTVLFSQRPRRTGEMDTATAIFLLARPRTAGVKKKFLTEDTVVYSSHMHIITRGWAMTFFKLDFLPNHGVKKRHKQPKSGVV